MKWGKAAAAIAAVSCGVLAGSMLTSFANSIPSAGQPGSAEDPVVTKSYVDEQIQKALTGQASGQASTMEQTINTLKTQVAALEAALKQVKESKPSSSVPFTVVTLKPGQTLLGGMGTEFIVRAGKANIHSGTENGIPDLTDGVDLKNGAQAPKDHLLLIPREGRGLKVDPAMKSDAVITVKGSYIQLDADGNAVVPASP
ncbi:hypothetical protein [Paenibacillus thermotolerans]|uniref:hypothetical protein n=1 Tax=Paenibacillus thermotolerans TaxID=3027807 RepID=UPI002368D8A9|nr:MULTISPECIES: hypothetical protein [unclassified Paenibacillus]